jgi:hypothetical protein
MIVVTVSPLKKFNLSHNGTRVGRLELAKSTISLELTKNAVSLELAESTISSELTERSLSVTGNHLLIQFNVLILNLQTLCTYLRVRRLELAKSAISLELTKSTISLELTESTVSLELTESTITLELTERSLSVTGNHLLTQLDNLKSPDT